MYIDRLSLTNIASLKGHHVIDFKNILAREGLFAITGPTGSGKSTLLSAISLALYGQGGKRSLNAKDYISEGAAKGEIALDFRLEGKSYRAHWSCSVLKKDGTPRATSLNKSYIEDLTTGEIVRTSGAELTKLTLEQFNQCVILHQGEFANFLASTFSKRREILAGLVDISKLDQVKEAYKERKNSLERKLDMLEQRLSASELFETGELAQMIERHGELKELVAARALIIKDFAELKMNFLKVREYFKIRDESLSKSSLTETQLEKEILAYQQEFTQFSASDVQLRKDEDQWASERAQVSALIETSSKLKLEKGLLEKVSAHLERITQEIARREVSAAQKEAEIKDIFLDFAPELWQQIYPQRARLEEALNKLEELSEEKLTWQNESEALKEELAELESLAAKLKDQMGQRGLESVPFYERERSGLQEKIKHLTALLEGLTQYEQLCQREEKYLNESHNEREKNRLEFESLAPKEEIKRQIDHQEGLLLREREISAHYEAILKLRQLSLAAHQCELCHSPIHELPELKVLEQREQQKKSAQHEATLTQWQRKLQQVEQLEASDSQLQQKHALHLEELRSILNSLKDLEASHDWKLENLSTQIKELKEKIQSEVRSGQAQYEELSQQLLATTKSEQQLHSYREEYQKKSTRLKEVHSRASALPAQIETTLSALKEFHSPQLSSLERSAIRALKTKLQQNCARYEQKILLERTLKETLEQIERARLERQGLEREHSEKSTLTRELTSNIPAIYRGIDLLAHMEQRDQALAGQKKGLREKERALDEKKNAIARAKEGLAHIAENLKNALEWIDRLRLELINKLGSVKDRTEFPLPTDLARRLELARSDFGELPYDVLAQIIDHAFTPWQNEVEENYQELRAEFSGLTSKLELQQKREKAIKEMEEELLHLRSKQHVLLTMKEFFGKNEFKDYVLAKLEDELIRVTNIELKKLCEGRYYLKSRPTTHGPEFIVIDYWLSLSERKVASLSGGETFMVSLALALGLAELSRGQTRIDSFFIDEGFGTLDPLTLESVTEVLLGLKGRGKVIGIISHVEALTSRLPRSLILQKTSAGESTLTYQEMIN